MPLIPPPFLFRFSIPVRELQKIPLTSKKAGAEFALNLPPDCSLPDFAEFEQRKPFGELRLAWNKNGLGFSVQVVGKKEAVRSKPENPWESDSLHLWIDTRNTQTIHRASRFCHHFVAVPPPGGKKKASADIRQLQIPRAREESALADPDQLLGRCEPTKDGYLLEVWLPAESLHGFDPDSNSKLGFYYYLRDSELGEQYLSVNQEFPFATDPSLWWTLDLKS